MKLNLSFKSAFDLKNVNCPYAVAWIDLDKKHSTKIDATNGVNPVWNEMITILFPSTSRVETAILYIDIMHAVSAANTKLSTLIGSTMLPIRVILDETRSKEKASFSLILERSQGSLEIQIEIKDTNIIQSEPTAPQPQLQPRPHSEPPAPQPQLQPRPQSEPTAQPQPQLQPRPQPLPRPQPQYQYQPQQMINQYPNVLGPMGPVYTVNSPQNLRPILVQRPVNAMLMPNMMMPQYYSPVVNQLNQMGRMLNSFERMNINNMGTVNNTGMLGNCTYVTYGNDPTTAQDVHINTTGYDDGSYATGTSDNVGYDGGPFDGNQFGTDEGLDYGGFDASGVDSGWFDDSGFDF